MPCNCNNPQRLSALDLRIAQRVSRGLPYDDLLQLDNVESEVLTNEGNQSADLEESVQLSLFESIEPEPDNQLDSESVDR